MRAVYRHELSSHFSSLTGYVFGAFLLLFAGIFTWVYNINGALANFEYALADMSIVFIIAIPILTMRVISEERRQKTDQLLYSLPLSMTQVVMGKYLAMLTILLIPTLILALYPILLSAYGELYLPAALGSLCGFFLLGAALLSMGMYISSVTESQAIAAGICFVVMLINYFLPSLSNLMGTGAFASYAAFAIILLLLVWVVYAMTKNQFATLVTCAVSQAGLLLWFIFQKGAFVGAFGNLVAKLSLFSQFYVFIGGVFDIKSVIYLISVCVLFVFLTVQSMEKRRWSE